MAVLASARLFLNHSMPFPHAFHSFISLVLRNVILIYLNGWNTKQSTISFLICIDCRLLFLGHAYPFQHAEFTPPVWYIYHALWHWFIYLSLGSLKQCPENAKMSRESHGCCVTTLFGICFPHCNYSSELQIYMGRAAVYPTSIHFSDMVHPSASLLCGRDLSFYSKKWSILLSNWLTVKIGTPLK